MLGISLCLHFIDKHKQAQMVPPTLPVIQVPSPLLGSLPTPAGERPITPIQNLLAPPNPSPPATPTPTFHISSPAEDIVPLVTETATTSSVTEDSPSRNNSHSRSPSSDGSLSDYPLAATSLALRDNSDVSYLFLLSQSSAP